MAEILILILPLRFFNHVSFLDGKHISKRFALILQKLGYNVRLVTWSDGPMRTQFESAGRILV